MLTGTVMIGKKWIVPNFVSMEEFGREKNFKGAALTAPLAMKIRLYANLIVDYRIHDFAVIQSVTSN